MSLSSVQNVLDGARSYLNDIDIPGGTFVDNPALLGAFGRGPFPSAYGRVAGMLAQIGSSRIERDFFCLIPAYQRILIPAQAELMDLSEPIHLRERGSVTSITIASTSATSPIQVTTAVPHGLANNADVIISQVDDSIAPLGRWYIKIVDTLNFTLNGSFTDENVGTGGFVSWSGEKFSLPLTPIDDLDDRDPSDRLTEYQWKNNAFYFHGATTGRQLWIEYLASPEPPLNPNTILPWDNCADVLACLSAMTLAGNKGWNAMATRLRKEALGDSGEANSSGGLLREFINIQILAKQREQQAPRPFRENFARNALWFY